MGPGLDHHVLYSHSTVHNIHITYTYVGQIEKTYMSKPVKKKKHIQIEKKMSQQLQMVK